VEETLAPGAVISEVARRHGLTPQQVFAWRRQARQRSAASGERKALFVPAVLESSSAEQMVCHRERKLMRRANLPAGIIEVQINGVTVRVGHGANAKTIAVVLRTLKGSA
jgi:transposase